MTKEKELQDQIEGVKTALCGKKTMEHAAWHEHAFQLNCCLLKHRSIAVVFGAVVCRAVLLGAVLLGAVRIRNDTKQ